VPALTCALITTALCSVKDNDIAAAAPGANTDGIHLELAGFAKQTREEWLDPYGVLLLDNAADAAAQYCLKYDIPAKQLRNAELATPGVKGIVGHVQVTGFSRSRRIPIPGQTSRGLSSLSGLKLRGRSTSRFQSRSGSNSFPDYQSQLSPARR
jgi:hypothetical protein